MMVMNAGIASDMSSVGSSLTELNIMSPTIMRTGVVAADGMARKRGEKNNATAKQTAITKAVRPERPPCATPDELSMNVHAADEPRSPEHMVPMESAMKSLFMPGTFPCASA